MDNDKLIKGAKIAGVVIGGAVVLFVVYKIYKTISGLGEGLGNLTDDLGLTTSQEQTDIQRLDFMSPDFYKKYDSKYLIARATAQRTAQILHDSVLPNPGTAGVSNMVVNNEAVVNLLKAIPSKVLMSWTAAQFVQMYPNKTITGYVIPALSAAAQKEVLRNFKSLREK